MKEAKSKRIKKQQQLIDCVPIISDAETWLPPLVGNLLFYSPLFLSLSFCFAQFELSLSLCTDRKLLAGKSSNRFHWLLFEAINLRRKLMKQTQLIERERENQQTNKQTNRQVYSSMKQR